MTDPALDEFGFPMRPPPLLEDRVTLDMLAATDETIRSIELRVADIEDVLRRARDELYAARRHQHHLVVRYRAQAARPLVEEP